MSSCQTAHIANGQVEALDLSISALKRMLLFATVFVAVASGQTPHLADGGAEAVDLERGAEALDLER